MFEEAYFILKPERGGAPEAMMIAEANRIVAEHTAPRHVRERRRRRMLSWPGFLLGAGTGGSLVALIWLIFG